MLGYNPVLPLVHLTKKVGGVKQHIWIHRGWSSWAPDIVPLTTWFVRHGGGALTGIIDPLPVPRMADLSSAIDKSPFHRYVKMSRVTK